MNSPKKEDRVLYTGAFRFPNGDAAASRVYGVGLLFKNAGFKVDFAGWEQSSTKNGYYTYNGHDCYSQSEFRTRELNGASRLFGFFFRGIKTIKWLWHHRKYSVIVLYNPPAFFSLGVLLLCRFFGIKAVLDSTEWFAANHLPGGRYGPAAFENWLRMHVVYKFFDHAICISEFLAQHYKKRNIVNIPPLLLDRRKIVSRPTIKSCIGFVYAGNAGKKDKLHSFILALPKLAQGLNKPVVLHVAGLTWDALAADIKSNGVDPEIYKPFVECYGRLSAVEVERLYGASNFSILFRENERYAVAGFPTKAVESWSFGCPIVMNPVGDVADIATDMKDAIFVAEGSIFPLLLRKIELIADDAAYEQMSINSRLLAEEKFSISAHQPRFDEFLNKVFHFDKNDRQ
ncbi:glycosyltransferase [Variovorax paradoxus]|uniref:Glycosyltransferase n=1 Tax=Variovorax paradoxus TaxID=34073 RepID=A0A5Q0LYQ7_VARPD|nr:glycosyltransferase [Variovorax paradoxus]QFZ81415.1 glycosyltransferase [Variovorax paradoxus]